MDAEPPNVMQMTTKETENDHKWMQDHLKQKQINYKKTTSPQKGSEK